MRALRLTLVAGLAFILAAAAPRSVESTHLKMIVGVTEDTAKCAEGGRGAAPRLVDG
jgi:hypothetical protein